jgi:18S rRNA (guanine1575-N7)-methyltransferase
VVDYPNSNKAKKVFLCLFVGSGAQQQTPQGLDGEEVDDAQARFERRRTRERTRERSGKRKNVKDKEWILKKKEVSMPQSYRSLSNTFYQLYRKRGKEKVPRDSKYTGRKRGPVF